MNYITPIVAYLSPLVLGLIVAFLVATSDFTRQGIKGLGKIILYYVALPPIVVMLIIGIIPGSGRFHLGFTDLIYLAIFLWGWLMMIAGVTCLAVKLALNKNVVYVAVSLLILLTNATVFYINPFISAWQDNPVLRQWIIKTGIAVNPMLTITGNLFHHDLLRSRAMYALCDIGPYYYYSYANWFTLWVIYMVIGVLTIGLAVIKKKGTTN
ncbi:MAG TPA: hypothetical protein VJC37_03325 [Planctomycetota bacterium]|nr:hypothetical protein [Planctomycetota bacterium]